MDPKQLDLSGEEVGMTYCAKMTETRKLAGRAEDGDEKMTETRVLGPLKIRAPDMATAFALLAEKYPPTLEGATVRWEVSEG